MKKIREKLREGISLRSSLYMFVVMFWFLPLMISLVVLGYIYSENIESKIKQTVELNVENATKSTLDKINQIITDSRSATYDYELKNIYDVFLEDNDDVVLYEDTLEYLNGKYSYNSLIESTFLVYANDEDMLYHTLRNGLKYDKGRYVKYFKDKVMQETLKIAKNLDTDVGFYEYNDNIYIIRNLLNSKFETFAVLIMKIDTNIITKDMLHIVWLKDIQVSLDGVTILESRNFKDYNTDVNVEYIKDDNIFYVNETAYTQDKALVTKAAVDATLFKTEQNNNTGILFTIAMCSSVLFYVLLIFFRKNISEPVDVLINATEKLETGELGYELDYNPTLKEFKKLTHRFNGLSIKLKEQFEYSNMEQIALHEARIKALQSQINPHFLNNTLELINWEARMAQNDKVCSMIESLSTMLNAAMARGGNAKVTVREELSYIDAYLYIISQRFDDRFKFEKDIQPEVWDALVPRLVLQPIVENAIEHGISHIARGEMQIKLYLENDKLVIDVIHDGTITQQDRENIDNLLEWSGEESIKKSNNGRIGIRNVNLRLKILCGAESSLSINSIDEHKVLSRIELPFIEKE